MDRTQLKDLFWLGVITLLPLTPLLASSRGFGHDWTAHLWMTAYYSEYFKEHLSFPGVINTVQIAGMPIPLFYGVLLYPYLGVAGAVVGAAWAMRAAVAVVFFVQSWQVFRLTTLAGRDKNLALLVTAATSWSVYALTNLYNRGAFAELIAVAWLMAAIGALGRVFLLPAAERRGGDVLSGLLCFVLAAGAHPITALCGGLFVALLAVVFFLQAEKRAQVARWGLVGGAAVAVVLGPWIYAVAKFGRELLVSRLDTRAIAYLEVDSVWSRLMPFPYDSRLAENYSLPFEQSPHLDVQVSAGLLLLALFVSILAGLMAWRRVRLHRPALWIMGIFWALFFFVFALSVTPALGRMLAPMGKIQYAYRLVSYLNLSLLVVVVSGLASLPAGWPEQFMKWRWRMLLLVFVLSVLGLAIKLQHAVERDFVVSDMIGARVMQLPRGFTGWRDYAILSGPAAADSPQTILNVALGAEAGFGRTNVVRVNLASARPVEIAVQPFPWNEVLFDGRAIATAAGTWQRPKGIIRFMPAGEHEIQYTWNPDAMWRWMNRISRVTLFLWVALVLGLSVARLRGRVKPAITVQ